MASGCTSSSTGGNNSGLFQKLTPDTQVQYTGPAIPQLSICNGDLLSEVEAVILQQILNFQQGVGITFTDIDLTTCDCFTQKVGCCGATVCQTLDCILQAYLECMCEMYSDIQTLKTEVGSMFDGPYDTGCLTGVTSSSKLPAIVQELIKELCAAEAAITSLQTQVTNLTTNLPTTIGNFLAGALQSCQSELSETGSGATYIATFKGFAPIGTIMPFNGNMGDFDSSGRGKTGTEVCGWAIADGRNGTINMKGLFPMGTTDMVGTSPVTGGTGYPNTTTGGEYLHILSALEIPNIVTSGTVSFSGPIGSLTMYIGRYKPGDNSGLSATLQPGGDQGTYPVSTSSGGYTEIPINATGGATVTSSSSGTKGLGHNNVPPYRALYFIQRIS